MKRIFAAIGLMMLLQNAWAIDIRTAKAEGLVGEATTGFIAAVHTPASAEVRAMIADAHNKRKAQVDCTARSIDTTAEQDANRIQELAVKKTARGHFYQDSSGR